MQARKTVQRLAYQPGVPDTHGNAADSWADPVDVPVFGWAPPDPDSENSVGRSQTIRDLDVLAPAGTDAQPGDRMIVAGDTYDVIGYPEDFTEGPFAYTAGVRINLNRSEG
jgi:hypothetical protein